MYIYPSTATKRYFPIIGKAKGKYVWDIDGNKYIDFTGSNLTTILGYNLCKSFINLNMRSFVNFCKLKQKTSLFI